MPAANPSSAVFDLTGVASVEDTYRVRLIGAGAANILDLGGNALDGEFSGAFPSGNGTAGGDFSARFVVANPPPTLLSLQTTVFGPRCSTGVTTARRPEGPAGRDELHERGGDVLERGRRRELGSAGTSESAAGDPANSYLVQKIEGTAVVGNACRSGARP